MTKDYTGQQLGNYSLMRLIGEGSYGRVYLGEHINLPSQAAIKVLKTDVVPLTDKDREMFLTEARTIAALEHPHIVRVRDYTFVDETPFFVMDYAPNGTLRERYTQGSIVPLAEVISYVEQIASALQYIHEQRLIHRDVKPGNMLLTATNNVLLGDFGLTIPSHRTETLITQQTGDVLGTTDYMAPEQGYGEPRPASDQYALGIVVYEWLCGTLPFKGNRNEIINGHERLPPPPLHEKNSSISPAIEHVILKALEKDYHRRFENVEAFSTALQLAYREEPPAEVHIPSSEKPMTDVHTEDISQASGTILSTYQSVSGAINAIDWSPDGTRIAAGSRNAVYVWNVANEQLVFEHYGHTRVNAVAWSPDGISLASAGSEGEVQVWNVVDQYKVSTNHGPLSSPAPRGGIWTAIYAFDPPPRRSVVVNAVAWSPDGQYVAAASSDTYAYIWNASHRNQTSSLKYEHHNGKVLSIAWSPDGKYIASGESEQKVHVWNASSMSEVFTYHNHSGPVSGVTWLPDSQHICSADESQNLILVWRATTGKLTSVYRGHSHWRKALACSPNGVLMVSVDADKTVHIWNVATGENTFIYRGHMHPVNAVVWSPDGTCVASADDNGTMQIWRAI